MSVKLCVCVCIVLCVSCALCVIIWIEGTTWARLRKTQSLCVCFLQMWEHECMTSTAWGRVTWLCCLSVCVCGNSAHVMNSWKHTDILCVSVCECAMMKIPIHSYLFWQADEFWVLGVTVAQSFVCVCAWAENIGIYSYKVLYLLLLGIRSLSGMNSL